MSHLTLSVAAEGSAGSAVLTIVRHGEVAAIG
jgi:hypothetical protein